MKKILLVAAVLECSLFMSGFDGQPAQGRGRWHFSIAEKRLTLQADEIC